MHFIITVKTRIGPPGLPPKSDQKSLGGTRFEREINAIQSFFFSKSAEKRRGGTQFEGYPIRVFTVISTQEWPRAFQKTESRKWDIIVYALCYSRPPVWIRPPWFLRETNPKIYSVNEAVLAWSPHSPARGQGDEITIQQPSMIGADLSDCWLPGLEQRWAADFAPSRHDFRPVGDDTPRKLVQA